MRSSEIGTKSVPFSTIWPDSMRPGGLMSRMNAMARVDLPHPDSPTKPIFMPRATSSVTPSTALTAPASV